MIVLKHGKKNPRKFVCINCGCEFVANAAEYWRSEKFGVVFYECDCPECNYTIKTSESWQEEDGQTICLTECH